VVRVPLCPTRSRRVARQDAKLVAGH